MIKHHSRHYDTIKIQYRCHDVMKRYMTSLNMRSEGIMEPCSVQSVGAAETVSMTWVTILNGVTTLTQEVITGTCNLLMVPVIARLLFAKDNGIVNIH